MGFTPLQPGPEMDFATICNERSIPYTVMLAYEDQNTMWPHSGNYFELLSKATEIEKLGVGKYSPKKQIARKHALVDRCDVLIYAVSPILKQSEVIRNAVRAGVHVHIINV